MRSQLAALGIVLLAFASGARAQTEATAPTEAVAAEEGGATAAESEAAESEAAQPRAEPPASEPPTSAPPASVAPASEVDEGDGGAPPIRVALYDYELNGVDARIGELVTASTLVELRKLQRVSVIGMAEIAAMLDLEAQKQLVGCDEDESCLAEIAGALGVDVLVVGTLAKVGDEHILGMRRIDQRKAQVAGSLSRRLVAEDGEEFLAALGPAVDELFGEYPLREGETRGVDDEVALRLNPPPVPQWAFWSVAGSAAGVSALAAAVGTLNLLVVGQFNGWMDQAQQQKVDWSRVAPLQASANVTAAGTWGLLVTGLALAGTAGVMSPWVDWRGYGDADQ
jgi:hypothetical protein